MERIDLAPARPQDLRDELGDDADARSFPVLLVRHEQQVAPPNAERRDALESGLGITEQARNGSEP